MNFKYIISVDADVTQTIRAAPEHFATLSHSTSPEPLSTKMSTISTAEKYHCKLKLENTTKIQKYAICYFAQEGKYFGCSLIISQSISVSSDGNERRKETKNNWQVPVGATFGIVFVMVVVGGCVIYKKKGNIKIFSK